MSYNLGLNNNLSLISSQIKTVITDIENISTGGDTSTLALEATQQLVKTALDTIHTDLQGDLKVNVVDVSQLATDSNLSTMSAKISDLLLLSELQNIDGVKINDGHPADTPYDYDLLQKTMTAKDSTHEDSRFRVDAYGRDGWHFINDTDQDASNVYWYSNGAGQGNQQNLLFQDVSSVYTVVTIDKTNSVNDCPYIVFYSPPTGTGDVIPSFAHSKWQFILPSNAQIFSSEKVVLYYGAVPKVHQNLRHLPLVLSSVGNNGPRSPTELVYLMSINTSSARSASNVDYLLHNTGFVALGGISREYSFHNSKDRKQKANLSTSNGLTVTGDFYPFNQTVNIDGCSPTIAGELKVLVTPNAVTTYAWTEKNFIPYVLGVPIPVDAVSAGILVSANDKTCIFGKLAYTVSTIPPVVIPVAVPMAPPPLMTSVLLSTTATVPHMMIQFSHDNVDWFDSTYVISVNENNIFSISESFAVNYIRFKLAEHDIDTISLNISLK